jgi:uncharacterized protein with HEPN domain
LSKDWRAYAQYILDGVDKLHVIAARGDIGEDVVLYDAALRNLQTLSEATQKLPDALKASYPDIEWQKISAFRNVLVHNYLGEIDPLTVMKIITEQIEPLAKVIRQMLND